VDGQPGLLAGPSPSDPRHRRAASVAGPHELDGHDQDHRRRERARAGPGRLPGHRPGSTTDRRSSPRMPTSPAGSSWTRHGS